MPRRLIDRELADALLTALHAVDPEDADRMEAAYEHLRDAASQEEWAEEMTELLEENGIEW